MRNERRADRLASARHKGQQVRVQPRLVIEPHGLRRDQRRLFRRLGQHGIAGRQGRRDLAGEDGEGEVPRADAGEDAASVQDQPVGLAHRPVQDLRPAEILLGQHGVVAAEVGGLPHLGDAVVQRFSGFPRQQRHQPVHVGFQRIGHGPQHRRPARSARAIPDDLRFRRGIGRIVDVLRRSLRHMAQHLRAVIGIGHGLGVRPGHQLAADDGAGGQLFRIDLLQGGGVTLAVGLLRIVPAERVLAVHVHVLGRGDLGVAVRVGLDRGDGVGGDCRGRHPLVQQGVDERRVGPVLQQATNQIGQQVLVAPDGSIGAHGHRPQGLGGGVIEGLAHAVQALELDLDPGLPGHVVHGRERVGVVGRELRIQMRRRVDHGAGADQIIQVRRCLGGEHRIVGSAHDLGPLDLGVPVGALDQPHHQPPLRRPRQLGDPCDRLRSALLIGLHGQTQPRPAAQFRLVRQPVQQLQRQGQPVRLFCVHGEVDVGARRDQGQPLDARVELVPDPAFMRRLIARRQGRQLDRDAVSGLRPLPPGCLAHGGDRVGVDLFIALGVGGGAGALAQHVETAQPALAVRPPQRRLDGAPDHELLAHDADGGGHGLTDDRFAQTPGDAGQEARQIGLGLLVGVNQLARQHQAPCRGVDEQAVGLAEVRRPVGRPDLLGDQPIARVLVRRAQQGFGQAHQGQTLAGAQREFLQEALHHPLLLLALARMLDQADGLVHDGPAGGGVERRGGQQRPDSRGLVGELAVVERVPVLGEGDRWRDVCVHGRAHKPFRVGTGGAATSRIPRNKRLMLIAPPR